MEFGFLFDWRVVFAHPIGQLELVQQRLLESAFVRLATEDKKLVLDVVICHAKVVSTRVGRNKA
jgi:hypothetical protein